MAGIPKKLLFDPTLRAILLSIEESPGDAVNLHALADWYEEHDRSHAVEAVRWLIDNGKMPYRYTFEKELRVHYDQWHDGWYWWCTEREREDQKWGYPDSCVLPHHLWGKLVHSLDYNPLVFREFPTIELAFDSFVRAWTRKRPWYRRRKKER